MADEPLIAQARTDLAGAVQPTAALLGRLAAAFGASGAEFLVTTEKDAGKLARWAGLDRAAAPAIWVARRFDELENSKKKPVRAMPERRGAVRPAPVTPLLPEGSERNVRHLPVGRSSWEGPRDDDRDLR